METYTLPSGVNPLAVNNNHNNNNNNNNKVTPCDISLFLLTVRLAIT
jgi:hypothetical protein